MACCRRVAAQTIVLSAFGLASCGLERFDHAAFRSRRGPSSSDDGHSRDDDRDSKKKKYDVVKDRFYYQNEDWFLGTTTTTQDDDDETAARQTPSNVVILLARSGAVILGSSTWTASLRWMVGAPWEVTGVIWVIAFLLAVIFPWMIRYPEEGAMVLLEGGEGAQVQQVRAAAAEGVSPSASKLPANCDFQDDDTVRGVPHSQRVRANKRAAWHLTDHVHVWAEEPLGSGRVFGYDMPTDANEDTETFIARLAKTTAVVVCEWVTRGHITVLTVAAEAYYESTLRARPPD